MEITKEEFIDLFDLEKNSDIPDYTIYKFNRQIEASYNIFKRLYNISEIKFMDKDYRTFIGIMRSRLTYNREFQQFLYYHGDKPKFEIKPFNNVYNSENSNIILTEYKTVGALIIDNEYTRINIKNSGYVALLEFFNELKNFYLNYGVEIFYINNATDKDNIYFTHPNQGIFWDGIKYESLYYNNFTEISGYTIKRVITNSDGCYFYNPLKPEIKRYIDSILESSYVKILSIEEL